jgi:hypothetical protein
MLPETKKTIEEKIKTSLEQLKKGKGIPIKKAMKWLTKKYNLS